jgi:RNA polymerase sigma-B factor
MVSDTRFPAAASRSADLDAVAEDYARRRTQSQGPQAQQLRDGMITDMLPLADRLAHRYYNSGEPIADLQQVARLGLVKAVDRYDSERGSFTAFAVVTIDGEIKRYFRDHTWGVRVPRRVQELSLHMSRARRDLIAELQRQPTDAEIAARCEVELPEINDARMSYAGYRPLPLSTPIGDTGQELGDVFGETDPDIDSAADQITVARLVKLLPAREHRILTMRFSENLTQAQIGEELGLSQMHVSRLLSRTLLWLRESLTTNVVPRWPGVGADEEDGRLTVVMRVDTTRSVQVRVNGELDRDNAVQLRRLLLDAVRCAARHRGVRLDMSGVSMLDAAGVAALLAVHEAARARQVTVRAVGLQPFVRRIAEISGLGALLSGPGGAHDGNS